MDWPKYKTRWPNAQFSRFVDTPVCRFHVQQMGQGPAILLLHGTGATTHSYADLMQLLAQKHTVIAVDLPGHGFSSGLHNQRANLPNVTRAIGGLMQHMEINVDCIVGHSAGAAIAVEMASAGFASPKSIVAINGAFYPFPGFAGEIFPALARMLFLNPFVPKFFAYSAGSQSRVARLIDSTGSKLNASQIELYQAAFSDADHVEGTLSLMANWNLGKMASRLEALEIPLLQVIGERDKTIEPDYADETAARLRHGHMQRMPHAGHLAHEEYPDRVTGIITDFVSGLAVKDGRELA